MSTLGPRSSPLAVSMVSVLLIAGCAGKREGRGSASQAPRYTVGRPGPGWTDQSPGSADHAWFHRELSATIYTSAACGARYEDGRLEDLSRHLTFGIASGDPLREEHTRLDDRAALIRVWPGALDGIAVQVATVVTKKHDCLYDMLYVAPPSRFDQGWPDFVAVIEGFSVSGR